MQLSHKYLTNLTPLRGLAALWVVLFHFQDFVIKFLPPQLARLSSRGYLMVDLFFIMSGFIIYHVYQEVFQYGITAKKFREFTVARFARIYPLHFFTLILAIVLFVPKWGWEAFDDPKGIVYNLLLIHAMGFQKTLTWNFPSWSICGEWWSYMIFPFVAIFLYRRKQLAIATLVILVFISYMGILYWIPRVDIHNPSLPAPHNMDTSFDFGYLRGMTGFVTGMLTYKLYRAGILTRVFSMDITAIAVITASLLYLQLGTNDGICIIFFALIVFTFAQSNNFLHRICNNRLAQYLGNISYSIYLVQFFPLFPLFALPINLPGVNYPKDATPITGFWVGAGYCLLYIFILIGVSSLTYYYIEKPCRKYINARWGKQRMPVYA